MGKKRLPYIPLFVDDYQRDTRHLSAEEHGVYMLLLMAAWASPNASLPDDDHKLAGLAKLSPIKWKKTKPVVMAFWHFDGRSKRWVQKRLKKERRLAVDRKRKSADAAATRWNETKKGNAKPMPDECHPFKAFKEKPNGFSQRASAQKKSAELKILEGATNG
jgi:uncharacterized protein YdaU (DUF1376 family)